MAPTRASLASPFGLPLAALLLLSACGSTSPQATAGPAAAGQNPGPSAVTATGTPPASSTTGASGSLGLAPAPVSATPAVAEPTTGPTSPPNPSPEGSAAYEAAARQKIEAADLSNDATIAEIGSVRFTAAGEQAARDVLAAGGSDDVVWAAVWVYGSAASDPAPLRPFAVSQDLSIRAMAAAVLISLGDPSGFPALEAPLTDEDQLRGSRPPVSIDVFAVSTVFNDVTAAGMPAPPSSDSDIATVGAGLAAWLQQHAADLRFDPASGSWVLP
jgi:hypothetical protein